MMLYLVTLRMALAALCVSFGLGGSVWFYELVLVSDCESW